MSNYRFHSFVFEQFAPDLCTFQNVWVFPLFSISKIAGEAKGFFLCPILTTTFVLLFSSQCVIINSTSFWQHNYQIPYVQWRWGRMVGVVDLLSNFCSWDEKWQISNSFCMGWGSETIDLHSNFCSRVQKWQSNICRGEGEYGIVKGLLMWRDHYEPQLDMCF